MSREKQAWYSVSIPYEMRDNQLWIRTINWPDQCPCCNEKDSTALETYKYEHKARFSQTSTASETRTASFPLEWEVPYCLECKEHMKFAENWKWGIFAICFFVPLVLTLMIDVSSSLLLIILYALFSIGGYALYQLILKMVVKPKRKPTCLDHNLAFSASSPPTDDYKVVFKFEREEYAQAFAELNAAELENNPGCAIRFIRFVGDKH